MQSSHRSPMYLKTAVFKSTLLLIWCQQQVPLFVPLGRNVTREVASFLVEWELLPGIFNQRLYLVNVGTKEQESVPIPDYERTLLISVSSRSAVLIGSKSRTYNASLVDFSTLQLQDLDLHVSCSPNESFTGCSAADVLYLFVMHDFQYMRLTLHQHSFTQHTWAKSSTQLSYPRLFLTVPNDHFVYLLLGSDRGVLAYVRYDVQTGEFSSSSSLRLPVYLSPLCPWVMLDDDKLLCLGKGFNSWVWDFRTAGAARKPTKQCQHVPKTQGITMLRGQEVYWVSERNSTHPLTTNSYSMETEVFKQDFLSR